MLRGRIIQSCKEAFKRLKKVTQPYFHLILFKNCTIFRLPVVAVVQEVATITTEADLEVVVATQTNESSLRQRNIFSKACLPKKLRNKFITRQTTN